MAGGGAAFNLGDVFVTFKANVDSVNNAISNVRAQSATLGDSVDAVGKKVSAVGSTFMPFSLAAGAALGLSTKAFMNFQQAMELIHTQAGASQKEVDNLTGAVQRLAPVVGTTPENLAKGLFFIESAGYRGAKAMDILKLAAEGAQVGDADLADTARALTGIMNTNIKGAENAGVAMGNLNAIVGAGMMHFQDLNAAIGTGFFSAAAAFGVSLQSAGAALATLTRYGMPAEAAATRLRMSMTLMATPTAAAQKVLQAAGFTMNDIKTNSDAMTAGLAAAHVKTSEMAADLQKPDGFNVAIQDLKDHLAKAGITGNDAAAVIAKAFGGGRSSGPILAMIQNTQALGDSFDQINKTAGNFPEAWAARQKDASFKAAQFKAELSTLEVQLGQAFFPTLEKVATQLGKVADWFSKLSPGTKTAIVDFVLFTAVLGPLLKIVGSFTQVFGLAAKGAKGLYDAVTSIPDAIGKIADKASSIQGGTVSAFGKIKDGVKTVIDKLGDAKNAAIDFGKQAASTAAQWVKSAADIAAGFVKTTASAVANAVKSSIAWIQAAHNSEDGFLGSLVKIAAGFIVTSVKAAIHATAVAASWTASAAVSAARWVFIELPRIIAGFVATTASAILQGARTATAWVTGAATSSFAWVTIELPKIVAGFVWTVGRAAFSAAAAAAAWVFNAAIAAAAWVAKDVGALVVMVARALWTAGQMGVAAAISSSAWSAAAAASAAAWGVATLGILADIALIIKAAQTVLDTLSVVRQSQADIAANNKSNAALVPQMQANALSPNPKVAASARNTLHMLGVPGYAQGVRNFFGGLAWVGESGPELVNLPSGSDVYPNSLSQQIINEGRTDSRGINLTVSLAGAQIIGGVPTQVAEKIGDAIITKLKQSTRI